ncbi:MAG TPA: hybrid sensor histidine kinase/response regulator [Steroidobacteraceae bacterium]
MNDPVPTGTVTVLPAHPVVAPDLEARVEAEQVASLYGTIRGAVATGTVMAAIVAAAYYLQVGRWTILAWFGLFLAGKLRYPLIAAYFKDPQAAARSHHWAAVVTRELVISSTIWGLAPWMLLPEGDVPLAALLMLMLLTLASAGMLSLASVRSAIFAHAVPMTVGLATALAWHGQGLELVLAACCVLYLFVTLQFALRQHRLIRHALVERFNNEALARQLAEQVDVARRASEEKTRFFASASHDLRQPLHAIALFGAVLDKELKGSPQQTNASRLMRAVEALGTSLDTLLDVSRLDAGIIVAEPRPITINALFQSLHPLFGQRAEEKGLQLRMRASDLAVRSDPDLLQRLLANVIENAIKYTPTGGVVVMARSRGPSVWIECYDTGIGIADEHLPRIFDEFYQASNPGRDRSRGLGIGLSIVRRLAQLLDHPVEVTTRPGKGTRFRVIVPAAGKDEPSIRPVVDQRVPAAGELPRRVLVLDDEADVGDAVAALLDAHGIETQVTRSEHDAGLALDHAAAQNRPFEVLVSDYRLAEGADGLEAALRLQRHGPSRMPVLLITGETSPERLQRVKESGIPVLFKPTTGPALVHALATLTRP